MVEAEALNNPELTLEDLKYIFKNHEESFINELEEEFKKGKSIENGLNNMDRKTLKLFSTLKRIVILESEIMVNNNMKLLRLCFNPDDLGKTAKELENKLNEKLFKKLKNLLITNETTNPSYNDSSHFNCFDILEIGEQPVQQVKQDINYFETQESFNPDQPMFESTSLKKFWISDPDKIEYVIVNGKYKTLGKGGQGEVFLGIYINETVAVKKISKHNILLRDFLRECNIMAEFSHPCITQILGYSITENYYYILMEYVPIGSLKGFLKVISNKNLAFDKICGIIRGILLGLSLLHEKNILHRDIKPANILLDNDLTPKFSDFGLSKLMQNSCDSNNTKGINGGGFGTKKYMAQEVKDFALYSKMADIWSLGVVLEEIIEFFKDTIPSEFRENLVVIIDQCKRKEPRERPEISPLLDLF